MTDRRQPSEKPVDPRWVQNAVRDIQRGDRLDERYRELFDAYREPLLRFFRLRGCSPEDASDLTQDLFLRVYKSLRSFRGDSSFETWLYTIAENVWRNELRRRGAAKREAEKRALAIDPTGGQDEEDGMDGVDAVDPQADLLEKAIARQTLERVERDLETLPPRMRQCVQLKGQGWKEHEIATSMKVKPSTVKKQLKDGRKRLRLLAAVTLYLLSALLWGG